MSGNSANRVYKSGEIYLIKHEFKIPSPRVFTHTIESVMGKVIQTKYYGEEGERIVLEITIDVIADLRKYFEDGTTTGIHRTFKKEDKFYIHKIRQ